MDWKDVAGKIAKVAPMLGTVLGGPLGGAAGGIVSMIASEFGLSPQETTPEAISQIISTDPNALVKLKEIEANSKVELQKLIVEMRTNKLAEETKQLTETNITMRTESKSEHWIQYSWRPFNGFCYPLAVLLIYFVLPLSNENVPEVPHWIWVGWLSILGVAVWDRGKEKRILAGGTNKGLIQGVIKAIRSE